MSDQDRLKALEAKLTAAEIARRPKPATQSKYDRANMAWQMVIELVVGMMIGLGIGWGLDSLFGTLPWMLIIFGLFGFAAGIKTMMGTATKMQRRSMRQMDDTGEQSPEVKKEG